MYCQGNGRLNPFCYAACSTVGEALVWSSMARATDVGPLGRVAQEILGTLELTKPQVMGNKGLRV